MRISYAVAYKQCLAPGNKTHGAPLAVFSCNPPVQASPILTVGTGDAWPGTTPKSVGFARIDVKTTSPEDVLLNGSATDIRCQGNSSPGFCSNANTDNAGVPDYSGTLQATSNIRITDHYNGPSGTEPATVGDLPFPVPVPCDPTPNAVEDPTIGSTCNVATTANGVVPGSVLDNKRGNVEVQTILVQDGGVDGNGTTEADNNLFATQGIWIP